MIRIGIICPSEIATRRFLPAIQNAPFINFIGVAVANKQEWIGVKDEVLDAEHKKAASIINQFGGRVFDGYHAMIESDDIDAVYLPLPPGLHYQWAKLALMNGKHVLVEKPCSTKMENTQELISIAREKHLALHENYMFVFHNQLEEINQVVVDGEIGDVRLYRISFGFPLRAKNDFRYNPHLGGGALLDCGGYTLRYASELLGDTARLVCAQSNNIDNYSVDMYGSATLVNDNGLTAQVSFGMDNDYKCELEIWGSHGTIYSGRILTAPEGFVPEMQIKKNGIVESRKLSADDAFLKSIKRFNECVNQSAIREANYDIIFRQSRMVDEFINLSNYSLNSQCKSVY
jgi:predicted dehydrogenase